MRRMYRIVLMAGLIALAPVLAGCADFDMDSLDFLHLNEKKKLPGERKELFPERRAGRHARHSARIPEGQSAAGGHRAGTGAGWRSCCGAGRQSSAARAGGKDRRDRAGAGAQGQTEAEAQAEAGYGKATAHAGHRAAGRAKPRQRRAEARAVAGYGTAAAARARARQRSLAVGAAASQHLVTLIFS